jgi:transcriptional regulator with XRE-family HTH domain
MMKRKKCKLNNCLKKYRKINGLKQGYVARVLGFKSTSMISRWENGKCMPDPVNIFKLSILYKTMPEALFIDLVRALRKQIAELEFTCQPQPADDQNIDE